MTFPPKPVPVCKRGVKRALPVGTWVTGRNLRGLHGFPRHYGHVISIKGKPKKSKWSNSGYRQSAACLECAVYFLEADGEFLQERLSGEALSEAATRLANEVKRKKALVSDIKEAMNAG